MEIIQLADRDNLPKDHPLRIKALELRDVLNGKMTAEKLLGTWARARRAYCEYTGTPLIDPVAIETGSKLVSFLSGVINRR
jgi:hypothetical protein